CRWSRASRDHSLLERLLSATAIREDLPPFFGSHLTLRLDQSRTRPTCRASRTDGARGQSQPPLLRSKLTLTTVGHVRAHGQNELATGRPKAAPLLGRAPRRGSEVPPRPLPQLLV